MARRQKNLQNSRWLLLTFGTSWGYYLNSENYLVANCHKVPAREFTKKLISSQEITDSFSKVYETIKLSNPSLRCIITVSPVRHLKDTMELNSVSKAQLRIAAYELEKQYQDVFYFPSYELMLDDLRDYRWYADDLLHPGQAAQDYVWEKFTAAYLDEESQSFINKWEKLTKQIHHKPFHPNHPDRIRQLTSLIEQVERLSEYGVGFEPELAYLNELISDLRSE
jgi:hypothetical protein